MGALVKFEGGVPTVIRTAGVALATPMELARRVIYRSSVMISRVPLVLATGAVPAAARVVFTRIASLGFVRLIGMILKSGLRSSPLVIIIMIAEYLLTQHSATEAEARATIQQHGLDGLFGGKDGVDGVQAMRRVLDMYKKSIPDDNARQWLAEVLGAPPASKAQGGAEEQGASSASEDAALAQAARSESGAGAHATQGAAFRTLMGFAAWSNALKEAIRALYVLDSKRYGAEEIMSAIGVLASYSPAEIREIREFTQTMKGVIR